ncbi:MAG: hypothetical protein OXC63_05900 [Aestuariivita sp.]|nr:hypothetical protein [Aestuariivita sp.]MCY4346326.1 hypothetical protein [Aestuariivita sp.]
MLISEPIEEAGFFWLPDDPNNRFPGFLRISKSGAITIEINSLSKISTLKRSLGDPYIGGGFIQFKRIAGVIKNRMVTLDGCSETRASTPITGGISTSTFDVHQAFIGVAYDEDEDVTFLRLQFALFGFDEWLGICGIEVTNEEKSFNVNFSLPTAKNFCIRDDLRMEFTFEATVPYMFSGYEATISQRAFVCLTPQTEAPLSELLPVALAIRNLLSLMNSKPASIESVRGYFDNRTVTATDDDYRPPAEIYFRESKPAADGHRLKANKTLVRFSEIEECVEIIFRKWIEFYHRHKFVLDRYFAFTLESTMDLERRITLLYEGLFAIHKKTSERDYHGSEIRLETILEPFRRYFEADAEFRSFIERVVRARNYYVHLHQKGRGEIPEHNELFQLNSKLEALFLLRAAGLEEAHS